MLLAVLVKDAAAAGKRSKRAPMRSFSRGPDAAAAVKAIQPLASEKAIVGAWLDRLDSAGADSLKRKRAAISS